MPESKPNAGRTIVSGADRISKQPSYAKLMAKDYAALKAACELALESYTGEPVRVACFKRMTYTKNPIDLPLKLTPEDFTRLIAELGENGWQARRSFAGRYLIIKKQESKLKTIKRLLKPKRP